MSQISTTRSGNVIVPYVEVKKRTKYVGKSVLAVTGNSGFDLLYISGYAYADSNGNWRFAFNLMAGQESATGATLTFPVTFHPSMEQAMLVTGDGPTTGACIAATGGSSSASYSFPTNVTAIRMSGDVALESKPTWADANMEDTTEVDIFISENSLPGSKLLDASIPMSKLSVELVATWGSYGAGNAWLVAGFDSRTHCGTVIGIKKDIVEWATPIQAISFGGYIPGQEFGPQGSMQIIPYDGGMGLDFTKHYANFQSANFLGKRADTWSPVSPALGDTVKLVVLVTPIS